MFKSDRILAVSVFTKRGFSKGLGIPKNKFSVVHNSFNENNFSKKKRDIKKLRDLFNINNKNKNVLYVGKLSKTKRPDVFIEVAKRVPEFNFLMVGKNILGLDLTKTENLYHITKLDREKVSEVFASSDLFMFPSEVEPFGLVIIEAMASGLPTIATDGGAFPEIISNKKNGFLIEKDKKEIENFVTKIRYILSNEELLRKFSSESINLSKKFDSRLISKKHEALYKELVKNKT
jgi:glycosyltransferase involved in cell wall biosynthesis